MKTNTRKTRVTLKTVAEKAGVSVATVSLILSGRDEWLKQFNPETIARVQGCAKRLGYRANLFATGLPMKTSSFFSLVLGNLRPSDLGTWYHWAFEGSMLAGVVRAAMERRLYPVVATTHSDADENDIRQVSKIINGGVFGSIVRSPKPELEKFLRTRIREGHPTVVVFPQRLAEWSTNAIDVDNVELGRMAGKLLLNRGRRHWAIARFQKGEGAVRLRSESFCEFARQAGIPVHPIPLEVGSSEFVVRDEVAAHLKQARVDGIFAVDSVASLGSNMACAMVGRGAGADIDLVGCDCAMFASNKLPKMTSIDISWREVGGIAFRKLMELVDQQASTFETSLLIPQIEDGKTCPVPPGMLAAAEPAGADGIATPVLAADR